MDSKWICKMTVVKSKPVLGCDDVAVMKVQDSQYRSIYEEDRSPSHVSDSTDCDFSQEDLDLYSNPLKRFGLNSSMSPEIPLQDDDIIPNQNQTAIYPPIKKRQSFVGSQDLYLSNSEIDQAHPTEVLESQDDVKSSDDQSTIPPSDIPEPDLGTAMPDNCCQAERKQKNNVEQHDNHWSKIQSYSDDVIHTSKEMKVSRNRNVSDCFAHTDIVKSISRTWSNQEAFDHDKVNLPPSPKWLARYGLDVHEENNKAAPSKLLEVEEDSNKYLIQAKTSVSILMDTGTQSDHFCQSTVDGRGDDAVRSEKLEDSSRTGTITQGLKTESNTIHDVLTTTTHVKDKDSQASTDLFASSNHTTQTVKSLEPRASQASNNTPCVESRSSSKSRIRSKDGKNSNTPKQCSFNEFIVEFKKHRIQEHQVSRNLKVSRDTEASGSSAKLKSLNSSKQELDSSAGTFLEPLVQMRPTSAVVEEKISNYEAKVRKSPASSEPSFYSEMNDMAYGTWLSASQRQSEGEHRKCMSLKATSTSQKKSKKNRRQKKSDNDRKMDLSFWKQEHEKALATLEELEERYARLLRKIHKGKTHNLNTRMTDLKFKLNQISKSHDEEKHSLVQSLQEMTKPSSVLKKVTRTRTEYLKQRHLRLYELIQKHRELSERLAVARSSKESRSVSDQMKDKAVTKTTESPQTSAFDFYPNTYPESETERRQINEITDTERGKKRKHEDENKTQRSDCSECMNGYVLQTSSENRVDMSSVTEDKIVVCKSNVNKSDVENTQEVCDTDKRSMNMLCTKSKSLQTSLSKSSTLTNHGEAVFYPCSESAAKNFMSTTKNRSIERKLFDSDKFGPPLEYDKTVMDCDSDQSIVEVTIKDESLIGPTNDRPCLITNSTKVSNVLSNGNTVMNTTTNDMPTLGLTSTFPSNRTSAAPNSVAVQKDMDSSLNSTCSQNAVVHEKNITGSGNKTESPTSVDSPVATTNQAENLTLPIALHHNIDQPSSSSRDLLPKSPCSTVSSSIFPTSSKELARRLQLRYGTRLVGSDPTVLGSQQEDCRIKVSKQTILSQPVQTPRQDYVNKVSRETILSQPVQTPRQDNVNKVSRETIISQPVQTPRQDNVNKVSRETIISQPVQTPRQDNVNKVSRETIISQPVQTPRQNNEKLALSHQNRTGVEAPLVCAYHNTDAPDVTRRETYSILTSKNTVFDKQRTPTADKFCYSNSSTPPHRLPAVFQVIVGGKQETFTEKFSQTQGKIAFSTIAAMPQPKAMTKKTRKAKKKVRTSVDNLKEDKVNNYQNTPLISIPLPASVSENGTLQNVVVDEPFDHVMMKKDRHVYLDTSQANTQPQSVSNIINNSATIAPARKPCLDSNAFVTPTIENIANPPRADVNSSPRAEVDECYSSRSNNSTTKQLEISKQQVQDRNESKRDSSQMINKLEKVRLISNSEILSSHSTHSFPEEFWTGRFSDVHMNAQFWEDLEKW